MREILEEPWNTHYPPVEVWLQLKVGEGESEKDIIFGRRPPYYINQNETMTFETENGMFIRGNYAWRYK